MHQVGRALAIQSLLPALTPAVALPSHAAGLVAIYGTNGERLSTGVGAGPGTAPPALSEQRLRQRNGLGMRRAESTGQAAAAGSGRGEASEGGMAVELEEMGGVLDRVASKEWRERCEGLQALQELVVSYPYVPEDQLVAMFDGVVPRLADGNSKVTLVALAVLTAIFPPLGESTAAALNTLVPALVANLGALPSVSARCGFALRQIERGVKSEMVSCFEQARQTRRFALRPTARWMR